MQRVKRSTAVAVKPAPPAGGTPGYFAAPNPQAGVEATVPGYEWFNSVQEEICAVITGAGIALDSAAHTQLNQAIYAIAAASVPAYASAAETIAGGIANKVTHPTGVKAAIDAAVSIAVSALVNAAPGALDTLSELAAALGNDANFAADVTNLIATKLPVSAKAWTELAQAGQDDTTYMTPLKVAQAISALASIADATEAVKGKIQLASLAETIAGLNGIKAVSPATLILTMLGGSGQSWQNMAGRLLNHTYYNDTGRPILFAVTFNNGGSPFNATQTVGGVSLTHYFHTGFGGVGTMLVPPGVGYSAGGAGLVSWIEFRS